MPSPTLVAIVAASAGELAPLRRRARVRRSESGGCPVWCGELEAQPVVMACTRAGLEDAACGLEALLQAHAVRAVIGTGVASGLSPDLDWGDVVVAREVRRDGEAPFPLDAAWRARAVAAGARPAVFVSVAGNGVCRAERLALWSGLAGSGDALDPVGRMLAAAVDTESAAWAETSRRRGVPCLLVRGIGDAVFDERPARSAGEGRRALDRRRAAARLILDPPSWPGALRSGLRAHAAAERAAQLVATILRSAPEDAVPARELLFADPARAAGRP